MLTIDPDGIVRLNGKRTGHYLPVTVREAIAAALPPAGAVALFVPADDAIGLASGRLTATIPVRQAATDALARCGSCPSPASPLCHPGCYMPTAEATGTPGVPFHADGCPNEGGPILTKVVENRYQVGFEPFPGVTAEYDTDGNELAWDGDSWAPLTYHDFDSATPVRRPIGPAHIYEARCGTCGETFNPHDVGDLTHIARHDGTECGGEGTLLGTYHDTATAAPTAIAGCPVLWTNGTYHVIDHPNDDGYTLYGSSRVGVFDERDSAILVGNLLTRPDVAPTDHHRAPGGCP